jgi:hypothetical protein
LNFLSIRGFCPRQAVISCVYLSGVSGPDERSFNVPLSVWNLASLASPLAPICLGGETSSRLCVYLSLGDLVQHWVCCEGGGVLSVCRHRHEDSGDHGPRRLEGRPRRLGRFCERAQVRRGENFGKVRMGRFSEHSRSRRKRIKPQGELLQSCSFRDRERVCEWARARSGPQRDGRHLATWGIE